MSGMCITINTIESHMDISDCKTAEEIRTAILDDEHIAILSELILHSWPLTKSQI